MGGERWEGVEQTAPGDWSPFYRETGHKDSSCLSERLCCVCWWDQAAGYLKKKKKKNFIYNQIGEEAQAVRT
jgi:hypothetical protein